MSFTALLLCKLFMNSISCLVVCLVIKLLRKIRFALLPESLPRFLTTSYRDNCYRVTKDFGSRLILPTLPSGNTVNRTAVRSTPFSSSVVVP